MPKSHRSKSMRNPKTQRTQIKHVRLSRRLHALAAMVTPGNRLADIGTDHALIPVSLLTEKRIPYAYACDIGTGPLERAAAHIRAHGLEDRTTLRQADGLQGIKPGEADTVLIAGMGGELMIRILREGAALQDSVKEWIFSPHTEWTQFRHYLRESGFQLIEEYLLQEEGKDYLLLKAVPGDGELPYREAESAGIPDTVAERFGPLLLKERNETALRLIRREIGKENALRERLRQSVSARAALRLRAVEDSLALLYALTEREYSAFPESKAETGTEEQTETEEQTKSNRSIVNRNAGRNISRIISGSSDRNINSSADEAGRGGREE